MEGKRESSPLASASLPGSRQALCVWLPTFELRLELVRAPELDATSVALLSPGEGTRRTLWQVSERGAEAGVRPGQLISQAISLCPSLTLLEPDPAHYDAAQEAMLEALMELTPVVEPAGRGRIFMGMDGLERLHGSPARQVTDHPPGSLPDLSPAPGGGHPGGAGLRESSAPGWRRPGPSRESRSWYPTRSFPLSWPPAPSPSFRWIPS